MRNDQRVETASLGKLAPAEAKDEVQPDPWHRPGPRAPVRVTAHLKLIDAPTSKAPGIVRGFSFFAVIFYPLRLIGYSRCKEDMTSSLPTPEDRVELLIICLES